MWVSLLVSFFLLYSYGTCMFVFLCFQTLFLYLPNLSLPQLLFPLLLFLPHVLACLA